jgi:AcrR family transcriptional regulator
MDPKEMREHVIKDAKCSLILDAAHKVFLEKGYINARIEDIAEAAGFSKPSIYAYFPDKEAIFLSLSIREIQNMFAKIEEVTSKSENSFRQILTNIFEIIIKNFVQTYSYFNTVTNIQSIKKAHEEISKHHELAENFYEIIKKGINLMEGIIKRAQDKKEISKACDPSKLSWYILSIIQGIHTRYCFILNKPPDVETEVEHAINFILNGISAK